MKTKLYSLFIALTCLFTLNSSSGKAQIYDQLPDNPLTGSWHSAQSSQSVQSGNYTNPLIISLMQQVKADSLRTIIQHLQDYGTRYPLHPNRKQVATWLMQKFISYGYSAAAPRVRNIISEAIMESIVKRDNLQPIKVSFLY